MGSKAKPGELISSFRMVSIQTVKFDLQAPSKTYKKGDAVFSYSVTPVLADEVPSNGKYEVIVNIKVKVIETEEIVCEIITRFDFLLTNFKKLLPKGKKGYALTMDISTTILGISLSTMRGILHEKTMGTALQSELLPTMNIQNFFVHKDDLKKKAKTTKKKK